jgi:hypothetical protein
MRRHGVHMKGSLYHRSAIAASDMTPTSACLTSPSYLRRRRTDDPRAAALARLQGLQRAVAGPGASPLVAAAWGWRDSKYLPCFVPPSDEQRAIVRFLDHADRRIRRYIRAKQRLIALLNGQKQAIIHHAVTRGLGAGVRLKPSGVEWLGEVPEHRVTKPLKRWAKINQATLREATDRAYEFRYVDMSAVGTGFLARPPSRRAAPSRPAWSAVESDS